MFDEKPGLYLAVADPGEGPGAPHSFRPKWDRPPPLFQSPDDWVPPLSELDPPLSSIPLAEAGKDKQ